MSLILPEKVLEKVKCSLCKNYLSCGSTKIIEGGRTACGRCASEETGVPSLFNKIAQFALFPCVNRYEGCNKLLQYNNVGKHEKECIGGKYPCPICPPDKYPSDSLQKLIHHYSQKHANFVLKSPEISLSLEDMIAARYSQGHYLYCDNINNYLFLIYVEWNGEMLNCNASVAGNRSKDVIQIIDKIYISRVCSAYNDNSTVFQITIDKLPQFKEIILLKFLFQMDSVPALILTNFIAPECGEKKHLYQNWPKILFGKRLINKWGLISIESRYFKLSDDSLKLVNTKHVNISIPVKCSFCENYFWNCIMESKSNIYTHGPNDECMICAKCYENEYATCYIHNKRFVEYFYLQAPIFNMFFYCRNNCGLSFSLWQLRKHEDECFELTNAEEVKLLFKKEVKEARSKNMPFKFCKGNAFKMNDPSLTKNTYRCGKIFVVTHDGFKLILNYEIRGFSLKIEDTHYYDISKYYIVFRILSRSGISEEMNDFTIQDIRDVHWIVILPNSVSKSIVHINKI